MELCRPEPGCTSVLGRRADGGRNRDVFQGRCKKKNEAIGILAECCGTDACSMAQFLSARGLISGTEAGKYHRKKTDKDKKLEECIALAEKGLTMQEAADRMGCTVASVRNFASRNGIKFAGNKTRKKPTERKNRTVEKKDAPTGMLEELIAWTAAAAKWIEAQNEGASVQMVQATAQEAALGYKTKDGKAWRLRLTMIENK